MIDFKKKGIACLTSDVDMHFDTYLKWRTAECFGYTFMIRITNTKHFKH